MITLTAKHRMKVQNKLKLCMILLVLIMLFSGCAVKENTSSESSEEYLAKTVTPVPETASDKPETMDNAAETANDATKTTDNAAKATDSANETAGNAPEKSSPSAPQDIAKIYFYDMGQAECILVQTKSENILVDAGAELHQEHHDLIRGYLEDAGVEKIDYFILTHPHPDHIGEAAGIVADYDIGEIYMPNITYESDEIEEATMLLGAIEEKGMTAIVPERGRTIQLDAGTLEFVTDSSLDWGKNLNNYSLGFRLSFASCDFLMCGDIETGAEKELVDSGAGLEADVLKITHHGSITSSTEIFLDAVCPSYAVISCGMNNIYGNPYQEVLDRLEDRGIIYYRTDYQGTITAAVTTSGIAWEMEKN